MKRLCVKVQFMIVNQVTKSCRALSEPLIEILSFDLLAKYELLLS